MTRASLLVAALFCWALGPGCRYNSLPTHVANVAVRPSPPAEPLNLSGFRKLRFSTNFRIQIKVGEPYFVEVNGTEAIENFVSVRRDGDEIRFGVIEQYRYAAPVNINISMPELAEIELDGTSTGEVTGIGGRRLAIFTNGTSSIKTAGKVGSLETQSHGESLIEAEQLEADIVHVKALGTSTTNVFATNTLNVVSAGSSTVAYKGNPTIEKVTADVSTVKKKL